MLYFFKFHNDRATYNNVAHIFFMEKTYTTNYLIEISIFMVVAELHIRKYYYKMYSRVLFQSPQECAKWRG